MSIYHIVIWWWWHWAQQDATIIDQYWLVLYVCGFHLFYAIDFKQSYSYNDQEIGSILCSILYTFLLLQIQKKNENEKKKSNIFLDTSQ